MMRAFSHPFRGFSVQYALQACIWFFFLVPSLWLYFSKEITHPIIATGLILLFIVIYGFAFGAVEYFPRGWSRKCRLLFFFVLLATITGASGFIMRFGALTFLVYLCAFVSFLAPIRVAIMSVTAMSAGGVAITLTLMPPQWGLTLLTCSVVPVFVLSMAVLSNWSESQAALQENLRLTREREAIAVDVHDLLGHTLTVINLKAELARRLVDNDPVRAQEELEIIAQLSRTSLAEVRSTVTRMRSPDFPGEVKAARRALETVGITAKLPENSQVAGNNQALFAWALRELVTNVVRHSQATRCEVQVSSQKLQVTDNGIGFDAPASTFASGLSGLQQRVHDAGGKVMFPTKNQVLITMNGDENPL